MPSRADCERKLHHYAGKNKWKQICKDVVQWRSLKMVHVIMSLCDCVANLLMWLQVYPPNLHVDQQDIINVNNQHLFFSDHVEQYFIAVICMWLFYDVHKGFKDHTHKRSRWRNQQLLPLALHTPD